MSDSTIWNVKAASNAEELANILLAAASGIKTQVIASPILAEPRCADLKQRLSEIADELHALQQDAFTK